MRLSSVLAIAALMTAALLGGAGCGSRAEPPLPIQFETPVVDIGMVYQGQTIRHPFKFRVWDDGPVRIEHVSTSCCGPKLIEPDLSGEVLLPGSEHVVYLMISDSHAAEWRDVVADIETAPVSPRPITARLHGMLVLGPTVYPYPLVIRQRLGEVPFGELQVKRIRTSDLDELALDGGRTIAEPFVLSCVRTESEPFGARPTDPPRFVDSLELVFRGNEPLGIGEHSFRVRLAWQSGMPVTEVPVTVEVTHPYRPALERLFCGELAPGTTHEFTVPMLRGDWERTIHLETAEAAHGCVEASFNRDREELTIWVAAPNEAGRFEDLVTLKFDDPQVPDVVLPVSGVVRVRELRDG